MITRQETMLVAGQRLIYTIRRSRRAKRMLLHVDGEGGVEVVLPWRAAAGHATRFVRDQQYWLHQQLAKHANKPRPRTYEDGSALPFLGQTLTLAIVREEQRQRATVTQQGQALTVWLPQQGSAKVALEAWYRRQARIFFTSAAEQLAHRLGVSVKKLSIGNHKTQWGSCSAKGRLSFNWRLLLGPRWVAEYVIAHEVAHLVHHNHSESYWAVVATVYPGYKQARRWLREHAGTLRW